MAAGLAVLSFTPALAGPGDEAVANALACQAVKGAKARLRCFDAALPALKTAYPSALALASERAEAARAAAAEQAAEEFGLAKRDEKASTNDFEKDAFGASDLPASARAEDEEEVKAVEASVVEVGKNNLGKIFVVLDNGQVWRQVSGDKSTPYIPRNSEGLPVIIKKGLMGSYFIKVGKAKDAFKAERIK
jgi:hypothetical protein